MDEEMKAEKVGCCKTQSKQSVADIQISTPMLLPLSLLLLKGLPVVSKLV